VGAYSTETGSERRGEPIAKGKINLKGGTTPKERRKNNFHTWL
jgi:hypothetical protein